jgi:cell division protein FtsB
MKKLRFNSKRLMAGGIIVLFIFMMMGLNARLSELFRLSAQRDSMATQVSNLDATTENLRTKIAYATSVAAVEDWARDEGHLVRPGDVLIIPLSPNGATVVPSVQPTPTPVVITNWQVWSALFFGE